MADHRRKIAQVKTASVFAVLGVLALTAAPANANVSHAYSTSFGAASSTPANPYPLSAPHDVVVDQESHDLYVTDGPNHRVEKFDSSGNFILMFGKDVNKTKTEEAGSGTGERNLCTAASGNVCQPGTSSSSAGSFQVPAYLAVDNYPGGEGDVYVGDTGDNLVQKFDSSGHLIGSWGESGQKDGADATDLPGFGPLTGVAVGGPAGELYVGGTHYSVDIWKYERDGTYIQWYAANGIPWLKSDQHGNFYYSGGTIFEAIPIGGGLNGANQDVNTYQIGTAEPTTGFALDPSSLEVYQDTGSVIDRYETGCAPPPEEKPCEPADNFGSGHLSGPSGIDVDGTSHAVYVANTAGNDVAVFEDVRPIVTTGAQGNTTETSVTLTGHVDPAGRGDITECYFEYGFEQSYGNVIPCSPDPAGNPPGSHFSSPMDVTATINDLSGGTKNHYRLVATNEAGATKRGADAIFSTTSPPSIGGLVAENLTATTGDLEAVVNPNGLETTYRFEFGPTPEYGESVPVPDGILSPSFADQEVSFHLTGLTPHIVYHYRLVAENEDGRTDAVDHTFNFYPPPCPNENVRQQTKANFLPDCRAYELVSPSDAGGTQFYPYGPNSGYATNPSRLSFTGLFSTIPEAGGSPIDGTGDLYVATRTAKGWVSRYVGWPSSEAAVDGGPAMGPPGSASLPYQPYPSNLSANGGSGPGGQNGVITDLNMDRFLSFNDGNQSIESIFGIDFENQTPIASTAPLVLAADGTRLGRWPTNLEVVPDGRYPLSASIYPHPGYVEPSEGPITTAPGGSHALDCPASYSGSGEASASDCPGDVTGSADLNHFVFATEWNVFAPGGQLTAPGSVYDNDTDHNTVVVASKTASGADIQPEPTDHAGDPLQIPDVSNDGSHILMASGGNGPCGFSSCPYPPCGEFYTATVRCPMQPSHLYMRVDDTVTYDVSKGHYVDYVGANADGTKVYFTSSQHLTSEDHDSSKDLYQWSQSTDSIKLASIGNNGAGNGDGCDVGFTEKCGIATFSTQSYCQLQTALGGNCLSDNSIAAGNGDIYFFSPEQLDGTRGIPMQENLYVYRDESVQYVTTLSPPEPSCFIIYGYATQCQPTQIVRMQVSPDDSHMAFVTSSQVTHYDNAGYLEMYTYEPATRQVVCVSCKPSGAPPKSDVQASQDGLFMTNDGRAFFATNDAIVPSDTNRAIDVYEYADGRPQLITPGTGDSRQAELTFFANSTPGLVGVSADGSDVYFSTYDTLVRQDHNGLFLKFYDARTGGGFSAPAPPPPCAAADECHGSASEPVSSLQGGTSQPLGSGGNVVRPKATHHKPRSRRHKAHRRKASKHRAGSRKPTRTGRAGR